MPVSFTLFFIYFKKKKNQLLPSTFTIYAILWLSTGSWVLFYAKELILKIPLCYMEMFSVNEDNKQ